MKKKGEITAHIGTCCTWPHNSVHHVTDDAYLPQRPPRISHHHLVHLKKSLPSLRSHPLLRQKPIHTQHPPDSADGIRTDKKKKEWLNTDGNRAKERKLKQVGDLSCRHLEWQASIAQGYYIPSLKTDTSGYQEPRVGAWWVKGW